MCLYEGLDGGGGGSGIHYSLNSIQTLLYVTVALPMPFCFRISISNCAVRVN